MIYLRSVHRLLVTAGIVPSSPILVTLMKEALSSYKTSVLTRATQRNIPGDNIFILTAMKTSNLKYDHVSCDLFFISGFHGKCLIQNICLQAWSSSLVSLYIMFWWMPQSSSSGHKHQDCPLPWITQDAAKGQDPPQSQQETLQRTVLTKI
jgi:hypothetical protein